MTFSMLLVLDSSRISLPSRELVWGVREGRVLPLGTRVDKVSSGELVSSLSSVLTIGLSPQLPKHLLLSISPSLEVPKLSSINYINR